MIRTKNLPFCCDLLELITLVVKEEDECRAPLKGDGEGKEGEDEDGDDLDMCGLDWD